MIDSLSPLFDTRGQELGVGEWLEVTQERVNQFADATDDHQWIHVDPERAAEGPYGSTIAHGFLTLSLILPLMRGIEMRLQNVAMSVNYGLNRVRFPAPVPVGSRIRASVRNLSIEMVSENTVQVINQVTVEVEGGTKPVCVAEQIGRHTF